MADNVSDDADETTDLLDGKEPDDAETNDAGWKSDKEEEKQEADDATKLHNVEREIQFLEPRADRLISAAQPHSVGLVANSAPSRQEQRREAERNAQQLLETDELMTFPFFRDLSTAWFISPRFIQTYQFLLATVYAVYAMLAIMILVFYIIDVEYAFFDGDMVYNETYVVLLFLAFNLALVLVGLYSTFIIGLSRDEIDKLRHIESQVQANRIQCGDVSQFLVDDGQHFLIANDKFIDSQSDVKYELSRALHRMHKLGVTIYDFAVKNNNERLDRLTHEIQMVYQDIFLSAVQMRCQHDRSRVIKLFYEKQLRKDNKAGLNREEFDALRDALDPIGNDDVHDQVVFNFPTFEEFDIDGNGNIDILEFDVKLAQVYQKAVEALLQQYEANKAVKAREYEKQFRQKEGGENASLLDSFSKRFKMK